MPPAIRIRIIQRILEEQTSASVRLLRERLKVNAMTLWRDLKRMEDMGLVRRVRWLPCRPPPVLSRWDDDRWQCSFH